MGFLPGSRGHPFSTHKPSGVSVAQERPGSGVCELPCWLLVGVILFGSAELRLE